MPRIRKKTSRRGSTNQREKIKHKVSETRKKRKKEAKKNTQWKSKQKKDPGIPNTFPFKDEILAEVAEQRKIAAEEKQRRKELKKLGLSETQDEPQEHADEQAVEGGDKHKSAGGSSIQETAEEIPLLINPDLPNLGSVLDCADVVVEVLDARDPLACRSSRLEERVRTSKKKLVFVLNKIDTCPREAVEAWASVLGQETPCLIFRSSSAHLPDAETTTGKGKAKERTDDALGLGFALKLFTKYAGEVKKDGPLTIAVVGVVNSGKSSVVNSLSRGNALPVYKLSSTHTDAPTTTPYAQEISLEVDGHQLRIIDTPGWSWVPSVGSSNTDAEVVRARDILLRSRGKVERLKDPIPVVNEIVSRANKEDLMLFYSIPAFPDNDVISFLTGVARANNVIKKGGPPDLTWASRIVLRDWSTGKFPRYTFPTTASKDSSPTDGDVLLELKTRKELRKSRGLLKLKESGIDSRQVDYERAWVAEELSSDSDEDEEDEDDAEIDELEDDESGEEDEDEDEDEEASDEEEAGEEDEEVLTAGKRKRSLKQKPLSPPRPAKKVAFAAGVKGDAKTMKTKGRGTKSTLKATEKKVSIVAAKNTKSHNKPSKAKTTNPESEAYDFSKFF
ncbi:P-loop containing nucleoside triphosphate hydrolase protein [Abortiporus biennis]|nr:P-loop containing nucleoside triphosphate hydrolase protein [Abortiporus biennis]